MEEEFTNQFGQVVRDGEENTIEDADNEPG
jgi:hypothetical protein